MSKRLEAVYENGVLRLLEPVDLQEHQRVTRDPLTKTVRVPPMKQNVTGRTLPCRPMRQSLWPIGRRRD